MYVRRQWILALAVRQSSSLTTMSIDRLPKRKVALLLGFNGGKYWGFQLQKTTDDKVFPTIESEMQKAYVHRDYKHDFLVVGWRRRVWCRRRTWRS